MSEKPITQRIKDRLAAYTAMLRDIDNQLERLDRMEMTMASPPGPDLTVCHADPAHHPTAQA